jgi:hypothetical protein
VGAQFLEPNAIQLPRQTRVPVRLGAHQIDELKAGPTIDPQIVQVLPKKAETLTEEKDGDEGENDDRDHGIAAKESLNEQLGADTSAASRFFSSEK